MTQQVGVPECGFFRIRLKRGGVWVAAAICRPCCCTINGGEDNELHEWSENCDRYPPVSCYVSGYENPDMMEKVWSFGQPIDAAEYRYLLDDRAWAEQNAPESPEANPTRAVDLSEIPPIF